MGQIHVKIDGPKRERQRKAVEAMDGLLVADRGSTVFVPLGTYACEPEALRTLAIRAGGSGWTSNRSVEGGWLIVKEAPPKGKAKWRDLALELREALKECLGWHDFADDLHKPIEVRAAYMRARAAIARATGEQG